MKQRDKTFGLRETERTRVDSVSRERSLRLGSRFVYSSSSPSLWVLAGDYILGSGVRSAGGGATPESDVTSCRSTTPTRSRSKTFEETNRTNIKKEFFRRKCSTPRSEIKVQLVEKNLMKIFYGRLIQRGGAGTPPPHVQCHFLLVRLRVRCRGRGRRRGRPSGKAVSGSSAGRRGGGWRFGGVNVQRCASVAHQQTAAAWSLQRCV